MSQIQQLLEEIKGVLFGLRNEDAKLVSLQSVFELDNSIGTLVEMPCGYCATKENQEAKWIIREL